MKRILIAFVCAFCVSCSEVTESYSSEPVVKQIVIQSFDEHVDIYVIRGHEYLFVKQGYGVGVCHLESCPCKSKQ